MAGAADKKQAVSNVKILKEIHLLTFSIQAISIVLVWYFHRPQSRWQSLVFSSPSWLCQYVLETTGRPKFATKDGRETLVSAGQDLKQSGLVEYMFDIIYMTLICHILMWVFGSNKVWLLYLAIPGYAGYKAWTLGKQFLPASKPKQDMELKEEPVKSKRQQKLEKNPRRQRVVAR